MAEKVPHRRHHRKQKKIDRLTKAQRHERLVQRQKEWIQQWIAFARAFIEALLKAEVEGMLGRPAHKWGDRTDPLEINACCNKCGRQQRGWFRGNGTYRRTLITENLVIRFRVPRLRCPPEADGGAVDVSFSLFVPYERISPELEEPALGGLQAVALGLTLGQVGAVTRPANGAPLAKSTINARVLEVSRLVEAFHQGTLERVPPVLLLDGLWVKVMEPTGERFVDKKGRERPRVKRKKIGLLVAYGVDPATGEWWVLDWERAEQEDEASWGRMLERLRQRGMTAEKGLRLIVSDGSEGLAAALAMVDLGRGIAHQRCIFHKLRNVGKAVKAAEAKSKEEKRKRRREVVKEAAGIYEGKDQAEIVQRRDEFVAKYQEAEPEAVATLLRDFEQTMVYLEVQEAARARGEARLRRALPTDHQRSGATEPASGGRRMVRQVVLFHSDVGMEVRVYLILKQAGAMLIPQGEDWLEDLEKELAAA